MKLNSSSTNIVKRLLTGRPSRPLRSLLKRIEVADLASLLTQLNTVERKTLIEGLVNIRKIAPVLCQIPEHQLTQVLDQIDHATLSETLKIAAIHDGAFLLSHVAEDKRAPLLEDMKAEQRALLLQYLNYPEGSAGRMMATHFFSVPDHITAQQGLELLQIGRASCRERVYARV